MQSNCLHLIPAMTEESYGDYKCISKEKDYTKVVTEYRLTKQTILDANSDISRNVILDKTNNAVALVPQVAWVMSVAVVLGLFK